MRVSRNGATLDVTVDGDGPPLLYLHGLLASAETARQEAPLGFQVATFDQRGHGQGPRFARADAYAIDEFVDDAIAVLDALGWAGATVGGTSMGAAVALRLALDHPGRVETLLLAGPAYDDEPIPTIPFHDEIAADLEQFGAVEAAARRRESMVSRGFPVEATKWLDSWMHHDGPSLAVTVRAVGRWVPFADLRELEDLPMPVAVVAWPDDPVHPVELAQRVAELSGARVRLLGGLAEVLTSPRAISRELTEASRLLRPNA